MINSILQCCLVCSAVAGNHTIAAGRIARPTTLAAAGAVAAAAAGGGAPAVEGEDADAAQFGDNGDDFLGHDDDEAGPGPGSLMGGHSDLDSTFTSFKSRGSSKALSSLPEDEARSVQASGRLQQDKLTHLTCLWHLDAVFKLQVTLDQRLCHQSCTTWSS